MFTKYHLSIDWCSNFDYSYYLFYFITVYNFLYIYFRLFGSHFTFFYRVKLIPWPKKLRRMGSEFLNIPDGNWRRYPSLKLLRSTKVLVLNSMLCHSVLNSFQWRSSIIQRKDLLFIIHPFYQDTGELLLSTGKQSIYLHKCWLYCCFYSYFKAMALLHINTLCEYDPVTVFLQSNFLYLIG